MCEIYSKLTWRRSGAFIIFKQISHFSSVSIIDSELENACWGKVLNCIRTPNNVGIIIPNAFVKDKISYSLLLLNYHKCYKKLELDQFLLIFVNFQKSLLSKG